MSYPADDQVFAYAQANGIDALELFAYAREHGALPRSQGDVTGFEATVARNQSELGWGGFQPADSYAYLSNFGTLPTTASQLMSWLQNQGFYDSQWQRVGTPTANQFYDVSTGQAQTFVTPAGATAPTSAPASSNALLVFAQAHPVLSGVGALAGAFLVAKVVGAIR